MLQWLEVFGRFHPVVLHLPIGVLAALALVELAALLRKRAPDREVTLLLIWLGAASAVVAGTTGFVLSREAGYSGDAVDTHLWLGIGVATGTVLAAVLHTRRLLRLYYGVLVLTLGAILPAGHLGATITHGEGFLTDPLHTREIRPVSTGALSSAVPPASAFVRTILPIFEARCGKCHGRTKQKGGLALNTAEAIEKGGEDGPVLVAGKLDESEIVRRLRLPADDDDHMPPAEKPQPTDGEIRGIEAWIAAGAPFEGEVSGLDAISPPFAAGAATPSEPTGPAPAPAAAVAALRDRLVHVQKIAGESNLLWIDFAAVPTTTDDDAASLLTPVRNQVSDLSLGRCAVGDATTALVATMPSLTRLDLRATAVTDAGLASLRAHARLEELVLAQTHLTDAAVDHLLAMAALKRVHLWHAGLSPEAVARLREQRPSLRVDTGDEPLAGAVETEKDLKLTGDAPPPGQAPVLAASLEPINTTCPVSGKPVDPNFAVVYKGRVIGFCCPNCPGQFWAEPAKFEAALPK